MVLEGEQSLRVLAACSVVPFPEHGRKALKQQQLQPQREGSGMAQVTRLQHAGQGSRPGLSLPHLSLSYAAA